MIKRRDGHALWYVIVARNSFVRPARKREGDSGQSGHSAVLLVVTHSNLESRFSSVGYAVPFPIKDLYVAVAAVVLFLPVTVLVHTIVVHVLKLVRGKNKVKAN